MVVVVVIIIGVALTAVRVVLVRLEAVLRDEVRVREAHNLHKHRRQNLFKSTVHGNFRGQVEKFHMH